MMTVDDMLSEVAKLVDTAPKNSPEPEKEEKPVQTVKAIEKSIVEKIEKKEPMKELKPEVKAEKASCSPAVTAKITLNLSIAKEIAYCIEKAAEQIGVRVVIALTDVGGNLMLLEAMDDSYIASIKAAQEKAYTAVALKMPTHEALKESRGGSLDGYTNGNGILMLGGGYPVVHNGAVAGGIGVSGGTKEQDMLLARIGTEYFKQRIKSL